ncbi:hypothetical protein [Dyella telluris]|uniref:Uncharacterized protein n=1 Tax=Dyella telluris TaxID=2763498 RepID=A0A7G8Q3J2_9GAMM|nr:hypothetical protein [Dyella telluris]QNK01350.1 hypothetical protein H8F01_20295 [Dyella telluris]
MFLALSFSGIAQSTELSCEGSAKGPNYALHLYLVGPTVTGFRFESADQTGSGDCQLQAFRDGRDASRFLKAEWASSLAVTTISIKDADGFHDPKDYATVAIRRGRDGYSLAYHMDGAASACGVRGYLPNEVAVAAGHKRCVES